MAYKYLHNDLPLKGSKTMHKYNTIDKLKMCYYSFKDLCNDLKARNLSTKGNLKVIDN